MKVVLLQDVKDIGKKNQLVDVSDGYGRNFLLPRKLAKEANASAINEVRTKDAAKAHHAAEELASAQALAAKLEDKTVVLTAKAGKAGKLFGAITSKDIASELSKKFGIDVDKRKIVLESDIKTFGSYQVAVKLHPGVTAKVTVSVQE